MIHPAFWQSESLASLTVEQRYLFVGLISNADDQGRLRGHVALIRSLVFPYDDADLEALGKDLGLLRDVGCIHLYEHEGKEYIQIVNWWRYQSPQWAYPSPIPAPENWQDRLKYRRGGQILHENWEAPGGFLAKALPKALGKASGYTHSITQHSDSTALDPGGAGAPGGQPSCEQGPCEAAPCPDMPCQDEANPGEAHQGGAHHGGKPDAVHDPPAPTTFQGWQARIQASKNRPAELRAMITALYPGRDPPDFGYIARVARSVGGAGRLADLLWQHSTRPPTGDVLAYVQKVAKGGKRHATRRQKPDRTGNEPAARDAAALRAQLQWQRRALVEAGGAGPGPPG